MLVQSILEDGFYVLVGVGLEGQGSGTGRFQTLWRIPFPQPQHPETGTIPLLGMGTILQDKGEQFLSLRADLSRPSDEAGGSPFEMFLMGFGHVLG